MSNKILRELRRIEMCAVVAAAGLAHGRTLGRAALLQRPHRLGFSLRCKLCRNRKPAWRIWLYFLYYYKQILKC